MENDNKFEKKKVPRMISGLAEANSLALKIKIEFLSNSVNS